MRDAPARRGNGDPLVPDEKNWTWVITQRCAECGVDASSLDLSTTPAMVRSIVRRWVAVLGADGVAERRRPDRWSTLEYGCHVRDVLRIYDGRLRRMLTEEGPRYENWDQDRSAVEHRYHEQDPAIVAAEILADGEQLAQTYERVGPHAWSRTGFRSDGAQFTVETFTRYLLHDPLHHLHDVGA